MKKLDFIKFLSAGFIAAASALAQTIWDGTADVSWYNSSQSEFTITTAEQLAGLAKLINEGQSMLFQDKTFTLGADIMLNDTTDWKEWETAAPANPWTAIGTQTNYFRGAFDGAGFIVAGVYINNSDNNQGLFGFLFGNATLKNLGVVASYIKAGNNVGGLAGYSRQYTITNCYATGNVSGTVTNVGAGIGGLVGYNYNGIITNCYATGNVSGTVASSNIGAGIGGLAGYIDAENSKITNCYATGNVSGTNYVGGLVGSAGQNGSAITNCYATGNVSGTDYVGGLVGSKNIASAITNCYATGNVSGTGSNVGGFAGSAYPSQNPVPNCYYDSETSGQSDDNKGTPKTTAEMKTQETFVDWDFSAVWGIDGDIDGGYPYLYVPVGNISGVLTSAVYNETKPLSATVQPEKAYSKTVSWSVIGEGATISANNITFTKAGQVTIKATIANGLGAGSDYTQDFVINVAKINYDMSGITFANKTVTHDGAAQSITISGTLPSGVTVTYTGNGQTAVGAHTVTANFATTNENYNVPTSMTATLTIEAAQENSITPTKSGNGLGIIFEKNVVSYELKIVKVALPNGKDGKIISVVIYDNTGNVVFSGEGAKVWDLRNKSGRIVANGSYLVIVEAKSGDKSYWYSAKVGVNVKR